MAELPDRIRVGYRDYAVEVLRPSEAESRDEHGFQSGIMGVIAIRVDTKPFEIADTFLHEVLHAAWRNAGLPRKDEEHAVTMLAHQLTQVWRDNPDFVAFISSKLTD